MFLVVVNFQQIYLFFRMDPGFPSTVRPIDGTQIRNQAPRVEEHGYVDGKFLFFYMQVRLLMYLKRKHLL